MTAAMVWISIALTGVICAATVVKNIHRQNGDRNAD